MPVHFIVNILDHYPPSRYLENLTLEEKNV